jgi:zona occludens toxin
MINLITGTPGAGKSAYALLMMLDVLKQGRPLFVHGVPNLQLRHTAVSCNSPSCDACQALDWPTLYRMPAAENWHEWAPDGAVLFFDEVQNVYRPRSSSAKVPDSVAAFEVHRHRGLDFYLVTQHPRLIDGNVRNLVSRHIHLVANWAGRQQYEWPECSDGLSNKTDAVKSSYKLPKKVFGLYKSASLHTKQERKLPAQVYILAACVVLMIVIGARFKTRYDQITSPAEAAAASPAPVESASVQPLPLRNPGGTDGQLEQSGNDLAKFDYNPKLPNLPESAPAFAELVKPVVFPKLSGCVVDRKEPEGCRCYTQQATPYFVSPDQCRAFVKYGRFDPYRPDAAGGSVASAGTGSDARADHTRPASDS